MKMFFFLFLENFKFIDVPIFRLFTRLIYLNVLHDICIISRIWKIGRNFLSRIHFEYIEKYH